MELIKYGSLLKIVQDITTYNYLNIRSKRKTQNVKVYEKALRAACASWALYKEFVQTTILAGSLRLNNIHWSTEITCFHELYIGVSIFPSWITEEPVNNLWWSVQNNGQIARSEFIEWTANTGLWKLWALWCAPQPHTTAETDKCYICWFKMNNNSTQTKCFCAFKKWASTLKLT